MIWRIALFILAVLIIWKRAGIVAIFAKFKYSRGDYYGALKIFKVADVIGNLGLGDKILYGYNCLRCGDLAAAKKALSMAYMLSKPDTADRFRIRSLQALLAWKQDDVEQAIEYLEEIYNSDYKTSNIYENLGIMYNLNGDFDRALEFNKEGYDYNSDDNIIVDNLAETYALMGNYDEALKVYEELIARDPEPRFPEAYYGYGEVLFATGDKKNGIEMIEKSLTKPFSFLSLRQKDEIEKMLEDYKCKI